MLIGSCALLTEAGTLLLQWPLNVVRFGKSCLSFGIRSFHLSYFTSLFPLKSSCTWR